MMHTKIDETSSDESLRAMKINGIKPFVSHECGVIERLNEAHALLMLLQGANGDGNAYGHIPELVSHAVDGICTLIALARLQASLALGGEG